MKSTIKTLTILFLLGFLFGCSSTKPDPNNPSDNKEIIYPKEYNYDEILEFEKTFIGTWNAFKPPIDKYDINYLGMEICPDDTPLPMYGRDDIFVENGLFNVSLDGSRFGYVCPSYWIDGVNQTSEHTYDVKLSFIGDAFNLDIIQGFTINVIDVDSIDVHFIFNEKEYISIESDYHFNRISKGWEASGEGYMDWLKENGYESVYLDSEHNTEYEDVSSDNE